MSHRQFNPEDEEDLKPLAAGLSDEDICALLKLARAATEEKILTIESKGGDAEIETGFLANGECGSGHWFYFIFAEQEWKLKESGSWIS